MISRRYKCRLVVQYQIFYKIHKCRILIWNKIKRGYFLWIFGLNFKIIHHGDLHDLFLSKTCQIVACLFLWPMSHSVSGHTQPNCLENKQLFSGIYSLPMAYTMEPRFQTSSSIGFDYDRFKNRHWSCNGAPTSHRWRHCGLLYRLHSGASSGK